MDSHVQTYEAHTPADRNIYTGLTLAGPTVVQQRVCQRSGNEANGTSQPYEPLSLAHSPTRTRRKHGEPRPQLQWARSHARTPSPPQKKEFSPKKMLHPVTPEKMQRRQLVRRHCPVNLLTCRARSATPPREQPRATTNTTHSQQEDSPRTCSPRAKLPHPPRDLQR